MADRELFPDLERNGPKGNYGSYDRYEVVSAWIKEMRLGSVENAFYWLAVMLEANESREFLARRLAIFAVEDAFDLQVAGAIAAMAWAVNRRQMDDNAVWQMTYWLCKAPKFFQGKELRWSDGGPSGLEYETLSWKALDAVKRGEKREIPSYAIDTHTRRGKERKRKGERIDERFSGNREGRQFMLEQYARLGRLDPADRVPGKTRHIHEPEPGIFMVEASVPGAYYRVDRAKQTCTCPAFEGGKRPCKHLTFVEVHVLRPE